MTDFRDNTLYVTALDANTIQLSMGPPNQQVQNPDARIIHQRSTKARVKAILYLTGVLQNQHRRLEGFKFEVSEEEYPALIHLMDKAVGDFDQVHEHFHELKVVRQESDALLEPTAEVQEIFDRLVQVRAESVLLEVERRRLEVKLKKVIGPHAGIRSIASWRTQTQNKVDAGRLRQELPDIYAEYAVTNATRYFRLFVGGEDD